MSLMMRVSQRTPRPGGSEGPAAVAMNRGIFLGAPRPVEGHRRHWPPWIISYPGQSSTKSITQLPVIKIEQAICHLKEKLNEESIAVAKIKSDPNFFLSDMLKNLVSVRFGDTY